jgi:hypothetical protein
MGEGGDGTKGIKERKKRGKGCKTERIIPHFMSRGHFTSLINESFTAGFMEAAD